MKKPPEKKKKDNGRKEGGEGGEIRRKGLPKIRESDSGDKT